MKRSEHLNPGFHKLGAWVAAHPRRVLGFWAFAIVIGALGAYKLPQVTVGGAGGIDPPSPSASTRKRRPLASTMCWLAVTSHSFG